MKLFCQFLFLGILLFSLKVAAAEPDSTAVSTPKNGKKLPISQEKDILDVAQSVFPHFKSKSHDTLAMQSGKKFIWLIPQLGYAAQTSFLAQILANIAFRRPEANVSTIISTLTYTLNKQALLAITPNIWTKNNAYNFIGDYRLMHYPQGTYGLGINTTTDKEIKMDYNYLRVYQYLLKNVSKNFYAGIGYNLDYHWNIVSSNDEHEVVKISHYTYGVEGTSVSSGVSLNLLYDNRLNSINPSQGFYANMVFRPNFTFLGSDNNFQTLLVDVRKYFHFPNHSNNILAFWSYNVLTLSGNPPFLDLPSTGWDTYSNTGRGFIQGRFRGKNLIYTEAEYRFGITKNHLLGGVVFANAETVAPNLSSFTKIVPAVGTGLRLNMNKFSRTNLAIDYAFGADGSHNLFFNLGEVF